MMMDVDIIADNVVFHIQFGQCGSLSLFGLLLGRDCLDRRRNRLLIVHRMVYMMMMMRSILYIIVVRLQEIRVISVGVQVVRGRGLFRLARIVGVMGIMTVVVVGNWLRDWFELIQIFWQWRETAYIIINLINLIVLVGNGAVRGVRRVLVC